MRVMQTLGVPYSADEIENAMISVDEQATLIANDLLSNSDIRLSFFEEKNVFGDAFVELKDREIISLIAYLQRLGTDIKGENK